MTGIRLLAFVSMTVGCLHVADDRARRDQQVGIAQAQGVSIRVDDGLAAIRDLTRDGAALWLQAPVVNLTVTFPVDAPTQFSLLVSNALADQALTVAGAAGGTVAPDVLQDTSPTLRSWRVSPPPGGGELRLTLAPPDRDRREPWRFAVYADVQDRIDDVQDIYGRMNLDPRIRFALISGDLTEQGAPDELRRFQREMTTLAFPAYATLGNHELGVRDDLFHEFFGRGNFSFVFRGVRFTLLDSASATIAPRALEWLDGWLAAGQGGLHVVTMHIPPLDPVGLRNGAFASRIEANALLGRLAAGGVDLTLYGHVHSFYAFSNADIPAYVSGGGGAIPERLDGIGRHYLTVDVDPERQKLQVGIVRVD